MTNLYAKVEKYITQSNRSGSFILRDDGQGVYIDTWNVPDLAVPDLEYINETITVEDLRYQAQRQAAYQKESDPLFFKYQRNECTEQDWLDKVTEIKQRYPKP